MKQFIFILTFISTLLSNKTTYAETKTPNRINIYIDRDIVCISPSNKCWPFAKGRSEYPTPIWEGAQELTTHYKNGFIWKNPLTGKVYPKGQHNLGNIWIQFYEDTDPKSKTYLWSYGIHETPYPNIPLSQQESHGCLRMTAEDIKSFSESINYFDKFYIIKD